MRPKEPLSRIILASASPRRLELLRSLGLEVEVRVSGYAEPPVAGETPLDAARRHAWAKLEAVRPAALAAVAADTVVDVDGVSFGKPADAAEATAMLRRLSGRAHRVHTAYALAVPGAEPVLACSTATVLFHSLGDAEIADYVATGEPFDKAGAYGVQGRAAALVRAVDGDFYTVVGFPLGSFIRALWRLGFSLPPPKG